MEKSPKKEKEYTTTVRIKAINEVPKEKKAKKNPREKLKTRRRNARKRRRKIS